MKKKVRSLSYQNVLRPDSLRIDVLLRVMQKYRPTTLDVAGGTDDNPAARIAIVGPIGHLSLAH